MRKRLARKNFLETSIPTFRRRKFETLEKCFRSSVLVGPLASVALVLQSSLWKLWAGDLSADIHHCPRPNTGRSLAPDHEIDMFSHSKSLEWLKISSNQIRFDARF